MPAGRPTSYDPAYCERVIALGREGKSKTYIATQLGVTRQTIDNWMEVHGEFFNSMALALELAQAWWEDAGQDGLHADKFNGSVWSRSMAARFPDDWREKQEIKHSGAVDLTAESDEALGKRLAQSLKGVPREAAVAFLAAKGIDPALMDE